MFRLPSRSLVWAVVASLSLVRFVSAAGYTPTWVPTGLNPGDTYHLVFTTSTTSDATSSAIADYDSFVDARGDTMAGSSGGGYLVLPRRHCHG